TLWSGKSSASVFQSLIVEEPMNSTAPFGGGLIRSAASYAATSFSHLSKSWAAVAELDDTPGALCAHAAGRATLMRATIANQTGKRLVVIVCLSRMMERDS